MLSFTLKKQISKNVADTTFKWFEGHFDPPVVFPKMCFSEKGWSADFLLILILS